MAPRSELTPEVFRQIAAAQGIEGDDTYLELLFTQVRNLRRQLDQLDAVDTADLEPETIFRLGRE